MRKFIAFKAVTDSEWDSVSFGLFSLDGENTLEYFKKMFDLAKSLHETNGINQLIKYSWDCNFFYDEQELPALYSDQVQKLEDEAFLLRITDDINVGRWTRPENKLKSTDIKFSVADVTFSSYGEHTGEEFWGTVSWENLFSMCLEAERSVATDAQLKNRTLTK